MGLKHYLNLFKKDSNIEAVKLRYFLNTFVFLVYMVFAAVFFSLRNTNIIVSSVFGLLAMAGLLTYRVLTQSFNKFLEKMMSNEVLDGNDETDAAFISYQRGYTANNEKEKAFNKRFFILNILSAALVTAIFPVIFVVNLMGLTHLADKIFYVDTIVMFAYLGLVVLINIFTGRKGVWYQDYFSELSVINKYKASVSDGAGVKFKLSEDKKQDKQTDYMLPDSELRTRYSKFQKMNKIAGIFFGATIGLGIFLPSILSLQGYTKLANILLPVIFGGGTALCIAVLLIIGFIQKKIMKKQHERFKLNEAENALYIKLHELRIPFVKRWNILFVVCPLSAIVSNIGFAGLVSVVAKTDAYGWVFALLFLVEFIGTYVLYFKAYGKVRQRMIKIENEIDKSK